MKELTISQLARYLLSLNDEFKKIHEDWNEARGEISDKLTNKNTTIEKKK